MSAADKTYEHLITFGIDSTKAREASRRYEDRVEAAVEWCFGAGADWEPTPMDTAPPVTIAAPASSAPQHIEHRPVQPPNFSTNPTNHFPQSRSPPPPLPPRRSPGPSSSPLFKTKPLGSNNPFANLDASRSGQAPSALWSASHADRRPGEGSLGVTFAEEVEAEPSREAQSQDVTRESAPWSDGSEQGARVSVTAAPDTDGDVDMDVNMDGSADDNDTQRRTERVRSLRATAPPPSLDGGDRDAEDDTKAIAFGPTTKTETGQTALVPTGNFNPAHNDISKEDEDLNRAIQDSLMTASFHSQPAIEQPLKLPRQEGAPLVFYSESNRATYAANFLQALHAVPQLRKAVMESVAEGIEPFNLTVPMKDLARLFAVFNSENDSSYENVDEIIKDLRGGEMPNQLPPSPPNRGFIEIVAKACKIVADNTKRLRPDLEGEPWVDTDLLLHTTTSPHLTPPPADVNFGRSSRLGNNVHAHLVDVLWWQGVEDGMTTPDNGRPTAIEALPDMLCISLTWEYGAKREIWELEEDLFLDRYMKENQVWTTQLRAQQSVAAGTARRLREKIEHLTMYRGYNYQDSLATLIAHYDAEVSTGTNDDRSPVRTELKAKLESTLASFKEKTAKLTAELEAEEALASGKLFESDDPDKQKQAFNLKAVLMHDGAIVPGRHLYAYIKGDDGRWWKIQDHEIHPTTFDEMKADRTGLFMDGGPYCLVYGRNGERPTKSVTSEPDEAGLVTAAASEEDPAPVPSQVEAKVADAPAKAEESVTTKQDEENLIDLGEDEPQTVADAPESASGSASGA